MITKDGAKMSKSKGNVVSPDEFVEKYGSDVFRMYLMFMGPFTDGGDWSDSGILGVVRFVDRFYRMVELSLEDGSQGLSNEDRLAAVHKCIARVAEAMEQMNFNVAIAALMELTNTTLKNGLAQEEKELVIRLIAPLAPHLAEELWEITGHEDPVFNHPYPEADESHLVESKVTYAVQVNGKVRATLEAAADMQKDDVIAAAKALENIAKYLDGGSIRKEIFVPGKIVGFVVGS